MSALDDALLDPQYSAWGTQASFTPERTGVAVELTVIDQTNGVAVTAKTSLEHHSPIVMQSVKPCADVRWSELKAKRLSREDLDKGKLKLYPDTTGEKFWRVRSHVLRPGFDGEESGEVRLVLEETGE